MSQTELQALLDSLPDAATLRKLQAERQGDAELLRSLVKVAEVREKLARGTADPNATASPAEVPQ